MSSRTDDSGYGDEAYKDEGTLRELYVEKGLTTPEIGEMFGVTGDAITYYMDKYGIERTRISDERLTDRDWLYEQYWLKGKTQKEISQMCGVNTKTVSNWMEKHNISVRETHQGPAQYYTEKDGYSYWTPQVNGDREWVAVHRLVAVAHYGLDRVTERDIVHHKNEIPWDNRPQNLEPMGWGEHTKLHKRKQHADAEWKDPDILRHEYIQKKQTIREVEEELNTTRTTVRKYLHKFDIPVRKTGESP